MGRPSTGFNQFVHRYSKQASVCAHVMIGRFYLLHRLHGLLCILHHLLALAKALLR